MGTTKKPRHAHRARLVSIPMTDGLRKEFAMTMHAALFGLRACPARHHFDALAQIFNVVSLTIENDTRFTHEARIIAGGARALNDIDTRFGELRIFQPSTIEVAPIRPAATAIDQILPRLDVTQLYLSMKRLTAMMQVAA